MIVKFGIMELGTERVLAELSGEGRDNAATARKIALPKAAIQNSDLTGWHGLPHASYRNEGALSRHQNSPSARKHLRPGDSLCDPRTPHKVPNSKILGIRWLCMLDTGARVVVRRLSRSPTVLDSDHPKPHAVCPPGFRWQCRKSSTIAPAAFVYRTDEEPLISFWDLQRA